MKTQVPSRLLAGALSVSVALPSFAQTRQVSVQLNGQPLALSATPLQLNGRTLLPLRDVFESLGASVNWNPVSQSIAAQSGTTQIQLGINNPVAFVNGRNVSLDQPAILVGGRAFVPLRFVAEATGAQVDYNNQLQLVSIQKAGIVGGGTQVAAYQNNSAPDYNAPADYNTPPAPVDYDVPDAPIDYNAPTDFNAPRENNFRTISVPVDSVVPVQLDTAISSNTSRVGQRFTASVVSHQIGDSEFPAGTKLEGIITEARPAQGKNPGVLDLNFQSAILPDGTRVRVRGDLTSLDQNGVSQRGGRLVANGARKNNDLKVIGIGAGAGFILGRVLKTNSTVTTVLGAAGGYLFGRSRDRKAQEARLAQNTTLGVRLLDPVRFRDTGGYSNLRQTFLGQNNRGFDPRDYGYDSRIDGSARDQYDGYQVSDRLPAPADTNDAYTDDYQPIYPDDTVQNGVDDNWNTGGNWNGGPLNNGAGRGNNNGNGNWNTGNGNPNGNGNWNGGGFDNGRDATFGNDGYTNQTDGFAQRISIPEGAVIPLRIDQQISSATARVGEEVSATIDSQRMGDSEFPAGTRIIGTVIESRPRQGDQPGVLDFDFRTALLPSGERIALRGELISLDDKGVQPRGGRLVAARGSSSKDRAKVIGIGAVAGFAIGRILNKGGVLPSVLGALGGYLYSQKNGKAQVNEAVLPQNARIGLRLDNSVSYNDNTYYASRAQYLRRN